jgi:DNA-binding transcriptional MerR regulator/effector-binding domain-containing protein
MVHDGPVTEAMSIGDFSRATHLSVKALRLYHREGLLEPDEVDDATGYRRYGVDQIHTAQVIRRLRDLDMPLNDISATLNAQDRGERSQQLMEHLRRLETRLEETHSAVESLRDLLSGPENLPEIEHVHEPGSVAAAIRQSVDLSDLSLWFQGAIGELYATVEGQSGEIVGPPGALIDTEFFTNESGTLTIYLPVRTRVRPIGRVDSHALPSVELATIVHEGSHVDIDRSYGALARYVTERAIALDGPIRERYLVGRHDTHDESQWRTEVGWPIFDASGPRTRTEEGC